MAGLNKVILIGNLGRDPEVRYTPAGMAIAKFSLATTERRKKGEQWEDVTEWHRITAFGKLGEICGEYLSKGKQVYIEGRIQYGSYEKDGQTVYTTDIIANQMVMLGSPGGAAAGGGGGGRGPAGGPGPGGGGGGGRPPAPEAPYTDMEDDIPF
jgi:single-strand DNA-binding protein